MPVRCEMSRCPNTCPKNLRYVNGLAMEAPERYTENSNAVEFLAVTLSSTNASTQIAENVSTTGELITILKFGLVPDVDFLYAILLPFVDYMIILAFSGKQEKVT